MRHRKASIKLNRTSSHREAMFRNMVTSLLKYDRIQTTKAKAKELRKWADHLITLAKKGDLHSRRQALSIVREGKVVHQLFEEANTRYGETAGGYTRIIKTGRRPGDAAPLVLIELIAKEKKEVKKPAKKKSEVDKEVKLEGVEKEVAKKKKTETVKEAKKPETPKKKEAARKKTAPKKKSAPKKKATKEKEEEKAADTKKGKSAGKKKAASVKKKAVPKKATAKKEKKEK